MQYLTGRGFEPILDGPAINDEGRYQIEDGRHPVVEASIGRERFVPNDTSLSGLTAAAR